MLSALKQLKWYVGELMGDHAYAHYVAHVQQAHPGAEIPSEKEFWRRRYAEQDADPGARCC